MLGATAVLAPMVAGVPAAQAVPRPAAKPVTFVPANKPGRHVTTRNWLAGHGVSVIRGRQCVELATRLYARNHWGSLNNIYGLRSGRLYEHKVTFHRNGSGYLPVPGDVVVELGGSYQHVAVVNRVSKHAIFTFEQNANPSGRHTYGWNGKKAWGAYGPRHVGGFIHSSKNHFI